MSEKNKFSRRTVLAGGSAAALAGIAGGLPATAAYANTGSSPSKAVTRPVTIRMGAHTNRFMGPELYGFATGSLINSSVGPDFTLTDNPELQASARSMEIPLLRFNAAGTSRVLKRVFAAGTDAPDWSHFDRWLANRSNFLASDGRLVFGIGPASNDRSITPDVWAEYARQTARFLRDHGAAPQYWEIGNENNKMGAEIYSTYFNAIADALHSVDGSCRIGGPVASWWNGINLPTFVANSADHHLGFLVFHNYNVSVTDTREQMYARALTFPGVAKARNAVQGTPAADLPIGLLEYNMNGQRRDDGTFGIPEQGVYVGAIYVALLLMQAVDSDTGFEMGGLWDLAYDTHYGAIGNRSSGGDFSVIDPQGVFLKQAAQQLVGEQRGLSIDGDGVRALAVSGDHGDTVAIVNYDTTTTARVRVHGLHAGGRSQVWALGSEWPNGKVLGHCWPDIDVPPETVAFVSGCDAGQ